MSRDINPPARRRPSDSPDNPHDHWVGMPEFEQEKQEPFSKIIIRCETQTDLDDLQERLGQKLTPKTKSIWHPHKPHRLPVKKVWIASNRPVHEDCSVGSCSRHQKCMYSPCRVRRA